MVLEALVGPQDQMALVDQLGLGILMVLQIQEDQGLLDHRWLQQILQVLLNLGLQSHQQHQVPLHYQVHRPGLQILSLQFHLLPLELLLDLYFLTALVDQ